jgi:hypothetical protein
VRSRSSSWGMLRSSTSADQRARVGGDAQRLRRLAPGEVLDAPGEGLEGGRVEGGEHPVGPVLGVGAVGDVAGCDRGMRVGPHEGGLGEVEARGAEGGGAEDVPGGREGAQQAQVVAVRDLDARGEAHHLEVSAQPRPGAGIGDQEDRLLAGDGGGGQVLDAALRAQHREGARGAHGRIGEDLGGDRGQPAAGVGPTDLEDLVAAEVDDGAAREKPALLAQRCAVVAGIPRSGPSSASTAPDPASSGGWIGRWEGAG